MNNKQQPPKVNQTDEHELDIAVANLIFSGLSMEQMNKLPKWLLENIEKNKPALRTSLANTITKADKTKDLDGRIVGMHELVFTLKFEGIPLTEEQKASYRNYVQQLEAQLTKEGKS